MEIAIRLPIFYMLENVLNKVIMVPQPHYCSKPTINLIKNSSLVSEELCYGLAQENWANLAKINLFHVFLISTCMILTATPLKNMIRSLKWLAPSTLLLWNVNYFYDCNIVLNQESLTGLRIITFMVVVYAIYKQLDVEYHQMYGYRVLKWLIPVTFELWSLNYFYDYAVYLSDTSLMVSRVLIFIIAFHTIWVAHQHEDYDNEEVDPDLMAALVFLLFAFGLKAAEAQLQKYVRLASLMCKIWSIDSEKLLGRIGRFIYLIFSLVELSSAGFLSLNCHPWNNYRSLMEWTCLEEIYHTNCVTLLKLYGIIYLILYFNTFILTTIQRKIFQNYAFEFHSETFFFSPVAYEISAIHSAFLSMNDESRWNAIQICCLINIVEFLLHLFYILDEILMDTKLEKNLHYKALGLSLLSIISSIFLLFFALWKFTFSVHLLLFVFVAFYVIILTLIAVLGYVVTNHKFYRESVEGLHCVELLSNLDSAAMGCMYLCLAFSFYLISTSQGFEFANFVGAYTYVLEVKKRVFQYGSLHLKYFKARKFIYFISEVTPEELKALDDVCLICHEEMTCGCVTPCKHHYHKRCLLAWLYENKKCPLCKFQLYC